ncbi:hypothetical protein P3342_007791 [Pyrenophora teres f. teres]|nr:hypothetical protein P3342_007791 [Pyrenophora teres f. teres]
MGPSHHAHGDTALSHTRFPPEGKQMALSTLRTTLLVLATCQNTANGPTSCECTAPCSQDDPPSDSCNNLVDCHYMRLRICPPTSRQHSALDSPWFRRRSRHLLPNQHSLRTIHRRQEILESIDHRKPKLGKDDLVPHCGTRWRARQGGSAEQTFGSQPCQCFRVLRKAQASLRTRYRLSRSPRPCRIPRHVCARCRMRDPQARRQEEVEGRGRVPRCHVCRVQPRKRIKRSKKPLGNLSLEILNHLSCYVHSVIDNETLKVGLYQNQAITSIVLLNEVLVGMDRVLQTPLPIAYSIAISQITWVYVMMLPFQLWDDLRWITIPGCIFAAYIIIGLSAIGREIENPFGHDVNDLPLEAYCEELEMDIDTITSQPPHSAQEFMRRDGNMPIWPLSHKNYMSWTHRSKQDIRDALMTKTKADMAVRKSFAVPRESESDEKEHHTIQQHHEN